MDRRSFRQGLVVPSHSPEETERLGRDFGQALKPGDLVGLIGPLGAGKTQWMKGVASALKVEGPVTSPTFTLMHRYRGPEVEMWHVDVYRFTGTEDPQELGMEELLEEGAVVLVEWADRLADWFSGFPHFQVSFTMGGVNQREIAITYVH